MHYRVTIAHENQKRSFVCEALDETAVIRVCRKALGKILTPKAPSEYEAPATVVPLKKIQEGLYDPDVTFVLAL